MVAQIVAYLENIQGFLIDHWIILTFSGMVFIFVEEAVKVWWHFYLHGIRHNYIHHAEKVVLQLRFPRENLKTPKAMEQVITSLHGTYSFGQTWRDEFIKGKVEDWFVLEMVGTATGITFYAIVLAGLKKMFEAAFFSQYPEVEIMEAEDYLQNLPEQIPNEEYNLYGTEFEMPNPEGHAMPVKTYQFFESPSDDQRLDPMATITEAISNLKDDEVFMMQLVIRAAGRDTHPEVYESAKNIVNRIMKREEKHEHKPGIMSHVGGFVKNVGVAFFDPPKWGEHEEEEPKFKMYEMTTPTEQDVAKAVENKISKNLFETIFRVVYIDKKDTFASDNAKAFFGAVTQFSDRNMNNFKPAPGSFTIPEKLKYLAASPNLFFKKRRMVNRKRALYKAYRERAFPAGHPLVPGDYFTQSIVLSAEELATVFHPPGAPITAIQKTSPVQAKKVGPPLTLPTFDQ